MYVACHNISYTIISYYIIFYHITSCYTIIVLQAEGEAALGRAAPARPRRGDGEQGQLGRPRGHGLFFAGDFPKC